MRTHFLNSFCRIAVLFVAAISGVAHGANVSADPSNYLTVIGGLQAGDTVTLAAGNYTSDLFVNNLNGTPAAWITIQGPASGAAAIFLADNSNNTVEIQNCSFLAIKNLTLEGQNLDGPFGVSAHNGLSNLVHDILIENCTIQNYNGSQQTDGISTKTPTWNWIIRGNRIINSGTGIYLGNSTGDDPFIAGIIENNLIQYPIGYCMQIKQQNPWPSVPGMPTGTTTTIIRNNVFIKNDAPSPDGDRPNLLVDGFPDSGPGSNNRYEIYGNLLYHNPRESLLQVSGRVTIHDNIFVDVPAGTAIAAQNHALPLKLAYIYNNTIYAAGTGINFSNAAPQGDNVSGNLVFASTPIAGPITNLRDNITDSVAQAGAYVNAPSAILGTMNFYPLPGKCSGTPLDMSAFTGDADYSLDFNGASKGTFTYRGAYAGSGVNPGWQLQAGIKPASGSVATPPTITSGPAATPNPAVVGQSVALSVAALSSDGSTLTYAWNFGDGASGSGSAVTHSYATAGTFTATVTVTTPSTLSATGTIVLTITASGSGSGTGTGTGTDTGTGTGTGTGGGTTNAPLPLTVSKLSGAFTFKGGHDSARVSGSISNVASGFRPAGTSVVLTINGAVINFTLDARGHGTSANGTIALKIPGKRNPTTHQIQFAGGTIGFTASLKNGTWASAWQMDSATSVKNGAASFDVDLQIGAQPYTATVPIEFQIKAGMGGKFKK